MTSAAFPDVVALRAAGTSLLLDAAGPDLPRVLHWGADLGPLTEGDLAQLAMASVPPVPHSSFTAVVPLPLLATERHGWSGTPGVSGHRDGADTAPSWQVQTVDRVPPVGPDAAAGGSGGELTVRAVDARAGLRLTLWVTMDEFGVVCLAAEVTNEGPGCYEVATLTPTLPLPPAAHEVLDLTGRWCRERSPQRSTLQHGTWQRASRRGRSGHDNSVLLAAGTAGFGFRRGRVWATSVAWSGDLVHLAEKLPEGHGAHSGVLGGGELLRPGEMRLEAGQAYRSPDVLFVHSPAGLDGVSDALHRRLRSRPGHPKRPRPVVLNTWEAVYFDHDLERLKQLAEVAASIGVERFVLDDGWFRHRRDDRAGLGDWYVDEQVWPQGLHPLAAHVRSLGMQVGLWFEPEMVNPDSDLARAHPDWILTPEAPEWRWQQLLDLANPDAFGYLLERLDSLVGEYGVDYVKWDHNRDLHVALHRVSGERTVPGVHRQTAALYRLLDTLRERHPRLEIESCASGGGRVDLGILQHTDRVWASDCNDALERQLIQLWTGLVVPPEIVGSHVGPPLSHTTERVLSLPFRCASALFGHAGIEWDISTCTPQELAVLRSWVALVKEKRGLLHTGDVVRADLDDPALLLHGVVSQDRAAALYQFVRLATSPEAMTGRVALPGLDPQRSYTVRLREDAGVASTTEIAPAPWTTAPVTLPGSVLTEAGLPMPLLNPAAALLIEVTAR